MTEAVTNAPLTNSSSGPALSILYLGPNHLTSGHRAKALERLGHRVTVVNPRSALPSFKILSYWNHHTGCRFLERLLRKRIIALIPPGRFDLIFVGVSEWIGPLLLQELKARAERVLCYVIDDPFGGRDGLRWRLFFKSLPLYDVVAVVRDCNVAEARAAGARNVIRVFMSADDVSHEPMPMTLEDRTKWASEVAFIGTWMPERGPFMARLVELGVPLSLYGNRWERAKEWQQLKPYWRGPALDNDEDYPKAVQSAKICLGLLSKGNRDLSTTRSFEIPHLGGVLCAERTLEHELLYRDGQEAVFWSTPEECAQKCASLLRDEKRRKEIAENGRLRCLQNRTTNESVLRQILESAGCGLPAPAGLESLS